MKKRLMFCLLLACLVFTAYMPPSASAYSGGLMNGSTLNVGSGINVTNKTMTTWTDNNVGTAGSLYQNEVAWMKLLNPKSIKEYQVKASGSAATWLKLRFYDSAGTLLYTENIDSTTSKSDGVKHDLGQVVKNVTYVALANTNTSTFATLAEVDVFEAPADTTPPTSPSILQATPHNGTTDLTWTVSTDPGDAAAIIKYKVFIDGANVTGTGITATSYTATGLANNTTHSYYVVAYDPAGNASAASNIVTTMFDTLSPLAPIGLAVNGQSATTGTLDHVMLTWMPNNEPDLAGYNVYREPNTKLNGSLLTVTYYEVTGLAANNTYSFSVSAVDNSNNESVHSASVSYVYDTIAPNLPTNVEVVADDGVASISFAASNSADVARYRIYRDGVPIGSVTDLSFLDSGLTNGTAYSYQISAIDAAGNESAKTAAIVVTPKAPHSPPNAPGQLSVTPRNGGLDATWSKSPEATNYNVYLDGVKVATQPGTMYQFAGLVNDTLYKVEVTAVNSIGESSKVAANGTPTTKAMPIMSLGYSLADIASGVAGWFSDIWLILAFSLSIPLSVYVAHRAKGLFD